MRHLVFVCFPLLLIGLYGSLALAAQPKQAADINLPNMGESATKSFSRNEQAIYGHRAYTQLKKQNVVLDDVETAAYLQSLGERIAAGTDDPSQEFLFFPVNSPVINAFAMPGGFIGMHTGLIIAAENENELAGVMAHEIVHVTQLHIARLIEQQAPWNTATTALVIAALLLGGGDPDITQAAIGAGLASGVERQVNYTRTHEHEADRLGVALMARAQLDPQGMVDFFQRLYKLRANYDNTYANILQTHPLTATRIAEASERAQNHPVANPQNTGLFAIIRERVRVLTTPSRDSASRLYPSQLANASNNPAIVYGQSLAASLGGDHERAIQGFSELVKADPNQILFQMGYAQALERGGQAAAALKQWQTAESLFPENSLLHYRYGLALLQLNRPQQAKQQFRLLHVDRQTDPEVNNLMARASAELGQLVEAHIYKANYWLYSGEGRYAENQLTTALREERLTPKDRARLKTKLEEVKENSKAAREGRL